MKPHLVRRFSGSLSAAFQTARYSDSIRWFRRALAENPPSTWNKRFLAPAYAFAGRTDEGHRTLAELMTAYPGLTITDVRSALPWNAQYLDRASEGLEHVGMRP